MLNNLMRIKLNSPKNLAEFPAVALAKSWVLQGHSRSDTPFSRKRLREDEDEDELPEEEFDDEDFDDYDDNIDDVSLYL